MIEFLVDQNFNGDIVDGLTRRDATLEMTHFLVSNDMPIGQAIDELLIAVHCLSADECKNLVRYFPM